MNIIKFKECNVVYAEDQKEYLPLPAHRTLDGRVTSCWGLTFKERIVVLFSGKIFVRMMTFNKPLQPLKVTVRNPVRGIK